MGTGGGALGGGAAAPARNEFPAFCTHRAPERFRRNEGKQVQDARPETIRRSLEGSLKRLRTDCIDLYCFHRVDPAVPLEEVAGVMADLIAEGRIRAWGPKPVP